MLPIYYVCNSCRETFFFPFREAYHHFGSPPAGGLIKDTDLLSLPKRPAWCKQCASVCIAEDILPVRVFEDAYGAVRAGKPVEYPIGTEWMEQGSAMEVLEGFLRWRMARRHPARALCCGGTDFQYIDVAQPLLKHAECDFGFIEPIYPGSYCGSRPGISEPANIRIYDSEGELLGRLTWFHPDKAEWEIETQHYPPAP